MSALALTVVACDSGGDNGNEEEREHKEEFPEPPGRPGFAATVSGDWRGTLVGAAETGSAGEALRIQLRSATGPEICIQFIVETPLQPGTYPIRPIEQDGVTARVRRPGDRAAWDAVEGTLGVTRLHREALDGRFHFTAEGARRRIVDVAGTFAIAPAME